MFFIPLPYLVIPLAATALVGGAITAYNYYKGNNNPKPETPVNDVPPKDVERENTELKNAVGKDPGLKDVGGKNDKIKNAQLNNAKPKSTDGKDGKLKDSDNKKISGKDKDVKNGVDDEEKEEEVYYYDESAFENPNEKQEDNKDLNEDDNLDFNFKKFPSVSDDDYRDVIVHLNDWKYTEIAAECPNLRDIGYAAVQVSSVTAFEKSIGWYQRLFVNSYEFENESGNRKELENMIEVCRKNNIKVFVDVVINHMAPKTLKTYIFNDGKVIYKDGDFHEKCFIEDGDYLKETSKMRDPFEKQTSGKQAPKGCDSKCNDYHEVLNSLEDIRNIYKETLNEEAFEMSSKLREHAKKEIIWSCWFAGLADLKIVDEKDRPKKQILDFLSELMFMGVSGFRVIMADFMNPKHLHKIYSWLPRQDLFIYHDVYDPLRNDPAAAQLVLQNEDYTKMTRATDYRYAAILEKSFLTRSIKLSDIYDLVQEDLNLLPSEDSVVFVNNFITSGTSNSGGLGLRRNIEKFIAPGGYAGSGGKALKLAIAFMLINGHGIPLITSSYIGYTNGQKDYNDEHKMALIKYLIGFRNVLRKHNGGSIPPVQNFQELQFYQVGYCIGNTAFVVFNNENPAQIIQKTFNTCFEKDGLYCDVFGGGLKPNDVYGPCYDNYMRVSKNGKEGYVFMNSYEGFAAFHIEAFRDFKIKK